MSFSFSAINLGCNKNMVDLEFIIGEILKHQDKFDVQFFDTPEDERVEYVIVNTCGFLSTSREESENTVRYYDDLGKKIIVTGCYIPVENDNFFSSLKNLHATLPFVNYDTVAELITKQKPAISLAKLSKIKASIGGDIKEKKLNQYLENIKGKTPFAPSPNVETIHELSPHELSGERKKLSESKKAFIWRGDETRAYFNASYGYEFLKIGEGCDNNCSFCIIPKIRGKQHSRDMENILTEVKTMIGQGIKEIQILSQDTTRYGTDNYGEAKLFELLEKIDQIPGDFEYKVYYLYPDVLTLEHLKKLTTLKKFIPYFDIPFQHISPAILKKMGRFYDEKQIYQLLDFIRTEFVVGNEYFRSLKETKELNNGAGQSFIHTNFIIGFPGETDEDFNQLVEFIEKYQFESISFFEYHDEPLAASSKLPNKVPHSIAIKRLNTLKAIVEKVYESNAKKRKGSTTTGYVMDYDKKNVTIRNRLQAPEIDEYDIIPYKNIISGEIELGEKVEYKV